MKELSIEEKAKAYDEAKARMNIAYNSNRCTIGFMNEIFPELKENEDKRIKNEIIAFIEQSIHRGGGTPIPQEQENKWIAWLEKQGNLMKALQISNAKIGELIEENYYLKEQLEKQRKNNMGISEATKQKLEDNLNKALEKETPESWNKFLDEQGSKESITCPVCGWEFEKQGEQNPIKEYNACEFCEDRYGCVSPCSMKLIEEEKFTNKVEPKFKIEEEKWYVCTQTFVLRGKIVVIKGQTYQAEKDNVIKGEDGCLFIDKHDGKASDYFRCWNIQDTKDGDVLCGYPKTDYPWIGIFHNLNTEGTFNSYCFLQAGQHGKFCPPSEENIFGKRNIDNHISEDIVPATKEQRDLLFQKMKEAGYEWDAENKQLRKIEPRQEELTEFEKAVKQVMEEAIECGDTHNLKADADMLLRLVQKSSWSAEDEHGFENCLYAIKETFKEVNNPHRVGTINWLKSLKERYTWMPSYEHVSVLEFVMKDIEKDSIRYRILNSVLEDLKKLREEKL